LVKVYLDSDASLKSLKKKTVAIFGYGNQGRAQALNMRDSGITVIVGLRKTGASWKLAQKDGFTPLEMGEASKESDIIHILTPDMVQPTLYKEYIEPYMKEGKTLGFSHGFNILYDLIEPPKEVDVLMIAPKSPGARVRETFLEGFGVPALLAIENNYSGKAHEIGLAMCKAIGCTRAGVIETTFKDETESDLIGEQTVLVGGLMELIRLGFETLLESGYSPELAYFEACNEAKLIMDLVYEKGITGMLRAVSDTAKFGGVAIGPKVLDDHVRENMRKVAEEVKSGKFAQEWIRTYQEDPTYLKRALGELEKHDLEMTGKRIRTMSKLEKEE
jgi:ketol-acid reductoisomerase